MVPSFSLPNIFYTIRVKLLASILLVFALSMAIALYGIWTYERDQFVEIAHQEAMRAALTIEKALRNSMLQNDRQLVQHTMDDIATILVPPSRVSIVANNGAVAFSTDSQLIGATIDRASDSSCAVCHAGKEIIPTQTAVMLANENGPFLRSIITISNDPACHGCHAADQKNLGILLFDSFLARTYDLLATVAYRTLLTGLMTFLVIVVVLCLLLNKVIHQPIATLQQGFIEVGRGNRHHWVTIAGGGEFAEMADSFNIMTRAIDRFVQEIKLKNKETATLYTVVQQISKTIDWIELKKILIDLLEEIFETNQSCLVLPDWTTNGSMEITWRSHHDSRLNCTRYSEGPSDFSCPALNHEDLQVWARQIPDQLLFLEHDTRVLIPLIYNKQSLGFILIRKQVGAIFSHSEKAFMPTLANHLSIAIKNAHLYHLAITDGLTGLFSKRHFVDSIDRLAIAYRENNADKFGLLMLDLDHFKKVNDSYGHPVGDLVLIQLAKLLQDKIRHGDIACRYGGEEFAILLPEISENLAVVNEVANRLHKAIAEHVFICEGAVPIRITASIGAALFPRDNDTVEGLIAAADSMLYEAKEQGRNQVRTYRPQG